jgi:hypothetical protein
MGERTLDGSNSQSKKFPWLPILVLSLGLISFELLRAPLVLGITTVGALAAAIWSSRRRSRLSRHNRENALKKDMKTIGALLVGLWAGVFGVLILADSGADVSIPTAIPVRLDGTTVGAQVLLVHGLVSSGATYLAILLWERRRQLRDRRLRRTRSK